VLDDAGEKIRKLKARTSEIKTNKEYQALLKEIESVEKERRSVEDEILAAMEETEAFSRLLKEEDVKFAVESAKVEEVKRKIEEERSVLGADLAEARAMRKGVAESVDPEVYGEYIKLMENCGGQAVVEAKEEICQGCNMNIPPQLFVEIKKNEEIIQCPQCRRILFYKPDTPLTEAPSR
jgi:uncharacterized protein